MLQYKMQLNLEVLKQRHATQATAFRELIPILKART